MRKIALIGSQELALQLTHYLETTGYAKVCGFFDDFESTSTTKHEIPVLGTPSEVPEFFKKTTFDSVLIAVGYKHKKYRMEIYEFLKNNGVLLDTFIHPSASVDPTSNIGEGSIVLMDTSIDMGCQIQENVLVAPGCLISHNVIVGTHSYLAPRTCIAGNVQIGRCSFLGIHTTCIDKISVGNNVIAAAGSVITENIPDHVMVAGVPAKIKKKFSSD